MHNGPINLYPEIMMVLFLRLLRREEARAGGRETERGACSRGSLAANDPRVRCIEWMLCGMPVPLRCGTTLAWAPAWALLPAPLTRSGHRLHSWGVDICVVA